MPTAAEATATAAACPFCGAASHSVYQDYELPLREGGRVFSYQECSACDLVFSSPSPNAEELEWLYTHRYDYTWFAKRRQLKRVQAWHRWRRLQPILQLHSQGKRRLLDVGGGHAWFLREAKAAGWDAQGLELLTDDLVKAASEHGIQTHHGMLTDHTLGDREFDVLTMWHSLEHMQDPKAALVGAAKLLAPGGLCIIAVPNRTAAGYRRMGSKWVWCQKPFIHPWHFSATALRKVLPENLKPVLVTSRDTWDAQYAESTPAWDLGMRAIYYACRVPRKAANIAGVKKLADAFDEVQFVAEEGLRIASYAAYVAARPLLSKTYEDALGGSELLMVARKPDAAPAN